jgi:hypothetical protein
LFNVVESSGNLVFEDNNPLRVRVVGYALGAYKFIIESVVVENFK